MSSAKPCALDAKAAPPSALGACAGSPGDLVLTFPLDGGQAIVVCTGIESPLCTQKGKHREGGDAARGHAREARAASLQPSAML